MADQSSSNRREKEEVEFFNFGANVTVPLKEIAATYAIFEAPLTVQSPAQLLLQLKEEEADWQTILTFRADHKLLQ
jgi:hypothetical protein